MTFLSREPGVIVAEVKMIRAASREPVLLLEGPTDSRFWDRDPNSRRVYQIVLGFGKEAVIGAIVKLDADGVRARRWHC